MSKKSPKVPFALNKQAELMLVQNAMLERQTWLRSVLDPRRDIEAECGHPLVLTIADYMNMYKRGDVGARVVRIWPEECWSEPPDIYESEEPEDTDFEMAWDELQTEHGIYSMFERVDTLSGIGRFGILLLGLDDGRELDQPVEGLLENGTFSESVPERKLLYLRAFDETCLSVAALESDRNNARYGQPKNYNIMFQDTAVGEQASVFTRTVHWSRVIHVADNRVSSEIFGLPRLELVVNRLLDLKKVSGGSGEMFWKGGFPGLSIEVLPEVAKDGGAEMDVASTQAQVEKYMNGLQRYLALSGLTAKSLAVQIADPRPHMETQLKLIAAAVGVPWRIFIGSEAAQLASEQDVRTWNRRIGRRRANYVSPYLIRPTIRRLIDVGVLQRPKDNKFFIHWDDLNSPSDKDKAQVAEGLSNAIVKYVAGGADVFMKPFHFLTLVLGMSDEEAQAVVSDAGIEDGLPEPEMPEEGDDALGEGQLSRSGVRTLPNGAARNSKSS